MLTCPSLSVCELFYFFLFDCLSIVFVSLHAFISAVGKLSCLQSTSFNVFHDAIGNCVFNNTYMSFLCLILIYTIVLHYLGLFYYAIGLLNIYYVNAIIVSLHIMISFVNVFSY